jgi:hypothetical protein
MLHFPLKEIPGNRGQRVGWLVLFLILGFGLGRSEETATVTTSDPVAFVKGTSRVKRPVRPDEVFTVISANGDNVTIGDPWGFQATLSRSLLKITGPATPSPTATNVAPAMPAAASNPPAPPPADVTDASPAVDSAPAENPPGPDDAKMIKQLNDAFQTPLFVDTNLWGEKDKDAASRLKWPQESATATDASYRRYALEGGAPILGTRAYSMALYSRNGHPTYISIVFANKGDLPGASAAGKDKSPVPEEQARKELNEAVKHDADIINAQLTAALGAPETHLFGPTANSRETVHRWNWKGHAILLSAPRNEYAAIKIVPSDVADHDGDVANMDRETIKAELAKRVLKNDNGDVVLQEIPMVDQGPKGYCVPATWERYLRYVDVPADMYVLAMLGNSGMGGGTNPNAIRSGVNDYVGSYGRRIEVADVPLDIAHISKFIDQGLPLMWTCWVMDNIEKDIDLHTSQRKKVADWENYKTGLQDDDKSLAPLNMNDPAVASRGHMRMIIGYNMQTNELAISDSWGSFAALRWITVKEAQNITQKDLEYIQW